MRSCHERHARGIPGVFCDFPTQVKGVQVQVQVRVRGKRGRRTMSSWRGSDDDVDASVKAHRLQDGRVARRSLQARVPASCAARYSR